VVRLSGNRPLNDPFIDLLLEANGSSGRIVRDYTVLLDPPATRQAAEHGGAHCTDRAPDQHPRRAPCRGGSARTPRTRRTAAVATAPRPSRRCTASPGHRHRSRTGNRASGAAAASKSPFSAATPPARSPAPTSRPTCRSTRCWSPCCWPTPMRSLAATSTACEAGAVLDLPSAAEASAVPAAEARRTVTAQSRDFGSTASAWPRTRRPSNVAAASRKASGKLQANVEDRNAAASAPDKLTISQGSASTRAADEKVAQARQAQDSSNRVAELSKNINELNKLKAGAGSSAPTAAAPARCRAWHSGADAVHQRDDDAASRRHPGARCRCPHARTGGSTRSAPQLRSRCTDA
jgi:pilus assembly protein FimV